MKNLILILFLVLAASANGATLKEGTTVCEEKKHYIQLVRAQKENDTDAFAYLTSNVCLTTKEEYSCTILSKKKPAEIRFYIKKYGLVEGLKGFTNIKNVK